MAESTPIDPGAPVPRDAIDPDLVKLPRSRGKLGIITCAGVVFLCVFAIVRLSADRAFSAGGQPQKVDVASILAGKVATESYVALDAEPLMANAIRTTAAKTSLGQRVTPVRGTGDRLWLVLPGDGWTAPTTSGYTGRLRKLAELPFADVLAEYASAHPRPVFASTTAARAAFSTGKLATVAGDTLAITDAAEVAFDVVEPNRSTITARFTEQTEDHGPLLDAAAWTAHLTKAGITPESTEPGKDGVKFGVALPAAEVTTKLQAANLWAASVDPMTRHVRTTWGALRSSPPDGFATPAGAAASAHIDLIGVYVSQPVPDDAYALITGERPEDYWYVTWILVGLGIIGLLFAWALVRAVRRDLFSGRGSAPAA
ncbi:MAG: hypothetical protein AB7O24_05945 [Kofleriaceae bacterium]